MKKRTGRIAFLGGSITHNGGWRDELMRYFTKRFPQTTFEFVAAGIPGPGVAASGAKAAVRRAWKSPNSWVITGP